MAKAAARKDAPKGRALKVFRTAIGFHDAYVAAPSKKAALAAWGTDKDLFARGAAEVVDDPALTAEALAAPGTVIRRTRGSLAEQLKAAGGTPVAKRANRPLEPDDAPPTRKRTKARAQTGARAQAQPQAPAPVPAPAPKPRVPRPRPSRDKLDAAEAARDGAATKAEAGRAALRAEEDALRQRREVFEREQRATLEKLDQAAEQARHAYAEAMERWRVEEA